MNPKVARAILLTAGLFFFCQMAYMGCSSYLKTHEKTLFFDSKTHVSFLDPSKEENRVHGAGLDLDEKTVNEIMEAVDRRQTVFADKWSIADCFYVESLVRNPNENSITIDNTPENKQYHNDLQCPRMGLSAFRCGQKSPVLGFQVEYPFSGSYSGVHIGDSLDAAKKAGISKGHADSLGRMTTIEVGDRGKSGNTTCVMVPR